MIRTKIILSALIGLAISQSASGQSNRVSGQFNFPPGFTANQGEIKFRVSTDPLSVITVNDVEQETSSVVTFERFARFSTYSIVLKDDLASSEPEPVFEDFKLNFECISGCPNNFLLTTVGYWDSAKGVVDENQAEIFSSDTLPSNPTVNIELDRADVFSGTVILPENTFANGDEQVRIAIVGSAQNDQPEFVQLLSPSKDASEVPFGIGVPRLSNVGGWNIELRCTECAPNIISDTHYPTTASGDPISLSQADSFFFRKFRSFSNLSLTLLAQEKPPGSRVMGAISLLLLDD